MVTSSEQGLLDAAPDEYRRLSPAEQERFVLHGERLLRRSSWEGARGFDLTDDMIVTIAAHAALLAAGFDADVHPYQNVAAVVVHGRTIITRGPQPGPVSGVVSTGPQYLAGQSGHGRGPVLLDWATVRRQVADPDRGVNVVYHEFAHKLDQLDGDADGMPPLPDDDSREAWVQTLGTNFRRLRRRGTDGLVSGYGATNPAEYFAVTSEVFFTRPVELLDRHPRVYQRLSDFYRQHPAARRR
ncbi:MAG: zinc-dependent peptidase [Ilumatobacteraceae bacterium]